MALTHFREKAFGLYLYDYMQSDFFKNMIEEITIGSTQNAITIATLGGQNVVLPNRNILSEYHNISLRINEKISHQKDLNVRLFELKNVLLSKMATEGDGTYEIHRREINTDFC